MISKEQRRLCAADELKEYQDEPGLQGWLPLHIRHCLRNLIRFVGDDPTRKGLEETPHRVLDAWAELCNGYAMDPDTFLTTFASTSMDEMVVLTNIEFYSVCEHHMLPFHGVAHVGYIVGPSLLGVSKLARLVDCYAHRLQVQERIGQEVVNCLMERVGAKGAGCVIAAKHLCMCARGVGKQHSVMVTSNLSGCMLEDSRARHEFLDLIKMGETFRG